ncbi:MAG: hypothetical protein ACRDAM_14905, partial [Casimicrobium sp.]
MTLVSLLSVLSVAAIKPVVAQTTRTWTSLGGPAFNWSDANHWNPRGQVQNGDILVFNGGITSNADLGSGVAIGGIRFSSGSGGAVVNGSVTIDGNASTINIEDQSIGGAGVVINAAIEVVGAELFVKASTGGRTLTLAGPVSGSPGLSFYGPGAVEMAPPFSNSYTGGTFVRSADSNGSAGTLRLSGQATAVVPGSLTIGRFGAARSASPAQVQLVGGLPELIIGTSRVAINTDGVFDMGALSETVAQITGTGSIKIGNANSVLTVGDSANFTFDGDITGPGSLYKVGTGTLRLGGTTANAYGRTTIERGVIEMNKTAGVTAVGAPIVIGNSSDAAGSATLKNLADDQIPDDAIMTINASGRYEPNAKSGSLPAETIGGLTGGGALVLSDNVKLSVNTASGQSHTFSGVITSPNLIGGVTKLNVRGAGEQVLTGNSPTYAAVLEVEGALKVMGDLG